MARRRIKGADRNAILTIIFEEFYKFYFLPRIFKYTRINRYKFTGVIYNQIFSNLIDLRVGARADPLRDTILRNEE